MATERTGARAGGANAELVRDVTVLLPAGSFSLRPYFTVQLDEERENRANFPEFSVYFTSCSNTNKHKEY